jgi:hypothetical protein
MRQLEYGLEEDRLRAVGWARRLWPPISRLAARVVAIFAFVGTAAAAPAIRPADIPEPLRAWVPWVLFGHEEVACPVAYNDASRHDCVWPSRLSLTLGAKAGSFTLEVETFAPESTVDLPGQLEAWPREVRANGRLLPVVGSGAGPQVRLPIGRFMVQGSFAWREMPQSLFVPPNVGTVAAILDGKALEWPDANGRLWLRRSIEAPLEADTLMVRVYRRIDDEIPVRVMTQLVLTAGGRPREVLLAAALLPDFVALSLDSPLPARLQPDGSLRVQLRAGTWTLAVEGRSHGPVAALASPGGRDEIWSFAAHNDLRIVSLDPAAGTPGVDPRQFGVPAAWSGLPAFRVGPGGALKLVERRRGDPEPEPDKLVLNRTMWLDFNGGGFTSHDLIRGSISRSWRLEAVPGIDLGRVSANGEEQFLTRLPTDAGKTGSGGSGSVGVEVRQGNARIEADSRASAGHELSVTGWQADFDRVSIELGLPPGWRLLHASGPDVVTGSWVASWSLWDFFFLALLLAASYRLHGVVAAAVLGSALILAWHRPGAPTWVWLVLLGFTGLLRLAESVGRDRGERVAYFARLGGWATLAVIVVMLLPFAVQELRAALYPALESAQTSKLFSVGEATPFPSRQASVAQAVADRTRALEERTREPAAPPPAPAPVASRELQSTAGMVEDIARNEPEEPKPDEKAKAGSASASGSFGSVHLRSFLQQDPNARIQTGPGLPNWRWHSYTLGWSGPVDRRQLVSLWLEPPWITRTLSVVGVLLLALAAWLHSRRPEGNVDGGRPEAGEAASQTDPARSNLGPGSGSRSGVALGLVPLLACLLGFLSVAPRAQAEPTPPAAAGEDWPSDARLEQLREHLQRPARCHPDCATVARLGISAAGSSLLLRLDLHAAADIVVPLPSGSNWHSSSVQVDGQPASLRRDGFADGSVWVRVAEGVHQVTMQADLSSAEQVQIALPLAPKVIESEVSGWSLEGVDARGLASGALTLSRMKKASQTAGRPFDVGEVARPFVRMVRTLRLAQQWTVETEVMRVGPAPTPMVVRISLIEGESVTDASVRVDGRTALVALGAGQNARFESSLPVQARIELKAADEINQIEVWRLDVAPMWHAQLSGIAPIQRQESNRWLPQWQPWPAERAVIEVVQPQGVAGPTLTIDRVDVTSRPGKRATDVSAVVALRSSQGGNHLVRLPPGAELRSVQIDGKTQPIRAEGQSVMLPVSPGARIAMLEWREPRGIETLFQGAQTEFGARSVNLHASIAVPADRWVLFVGGPVLGPAVLFWGIAVAVAGAALVLARLRWTPLVMWTGCCWASVLRRLPWAVLSSWLRSFSPLLPALALVRARGAGVST